jgi:hemerythrin-like domain-containing protein
LRETNTPPNGGVFHVSRATWASVSALSAPFEVPERRGTTDGTNTQSGGTAMPDPVVLLKKDHREVEAMLKTLAASKPGARRQSTLKKMDQALTLHMQIEEDDVYPLVAKLLGKDDAQEANIEHDLARDGLQKMKELVDKPGFGAAVAMVTAGIKHHVKEEEHEMFPELKRKLPRDQLLELGDEVEAAKRSSRGKP